MVRKRFRAFNGTLLPKRPRNGRHSPEQHGCSEFAVKPSAPGFKQSRVVLRPERCLSSHRSSLFATSWGKSDVNCDRRVVVEHRTNTLSGTPPSDPNTISPVANPSSLTSNRIFLPCAAEEPHLGPGSGKVRHQLRYERRLARAPRRLHVLCSVQRPWRRDVYLPRTAVTSFDMNGTHCRSSFSRSLVLSFRVQIDLVSSSGGGTWFQFRTAQCGGFVTG